MKLYVCGQSFADFNYKVEWLNPDISLAFSALVVVPTYQLKGYAYQPFFRKGVIEKTLFPPIDEGTGLVRLTHNPGINVSPTWSPDGQKIAFVSNREGNPQIYIMEANGQNVQRLTFEGKYNTQPSWSPRGDRIAFAGTLEGGRNICTIRPDGSDLRVLGANLGKCETPSWSPDGRNLVFSSDRDGEPHIFLMDAEGTRIKKLTSQRGKDSDPYWIPRGLAPK